MNRPKERASVKLVVARQRLERNANKFEAGMELAVVFPDSSGGA